MKKIIMLGITIFISLNVFAQQFKIRGVLPWHNFLSGPSAWNLDDYEKYLDQCAGQNLNFIAFHNYTGGGERYINYVEPLIKINYNHVTPNAFLDNSGTARWGYLPMKVKDFQFGTDTLFHLPNGAEYFGADCSILAKNNEERYNKAQQLMQQVLQMAHDRKMRTAIGFEFGIAPPEYLSLKRDHNMYWIGNGNFVYNPFNNEAVEILYATLDNLIETYKNLDWVMLWLNELCTHGVSVNNALSTPAMKNYYDANVGAFEKRGIKDELKFLGVWSQAYIQLAYDYIKQKAPHMRVAISGWGSEDQLPLLLDGLHKNLPKDIVFSCLNPDQGNGFHPDVFAEITKTREVWAIPWIEGDRSLWHLQPRVELTKNSVKKAANDNLDGVIAIHWRTEEIRPNFETFGHFASRPDDELSSERIYQNWCVREYGKKSGMKLYPVLYDIDKDEVLKNILSKEYFAYNSSYGRLSQLQLTTCNIVIDEVDSLLKKEKNQDYRKNLTNLKYNYSFMLLLHEVGLKLEIPWQNKDKFYAGKTDKSELVQIKGEMLNLLKQAPIKEMIETYAMKIRSQGELGTLSSLNQKVWQEYDGLVKFYETL